ncbi:MAG TPA: hypothetical protein VGJ28_25125 [Micromonosporaceae bacterium]
MVETAGAVLIAESGDRAVYLRPDDIAAFRELIELILARPTVAGPPLIREPLIDLDAKLAAGAGTVSLAAVDEECLMLLRHQMALRSKLPLRVQRTCATCGKTKIENPNLITKSKAYENTGSVAGAVLETAGLLAGGHHIRAVIKVMGSVSEIAGKNQKEVPACEDCQGQEFETPSVTYCPNCRKLRPETILLRCPDCEHDFVDAASIVDMWTGTDRAYADFRVSSNAARFAELAPRFENRLYGDQRKFLLAQLTAADELIAMCRCGRPGESLRSVALLLTTYQLIWARQLGAGGLTGGAVPWSAVTAVRSSPASVQIEAAESVLAFDSFRNVGVTFGGRPATFTATGIAALASEFTGLDVQLPAPPPPPPVSAPPFTPVPPLEPMVPDSMQPLLEPAPQAGLVQPAAPPLSRAAPAAPFPVPSSHPLPSPVSASPDAALPGPEPIAFPLPVPQPLAGPTSALPVAAEPEPVTGPVSVPRPPVARASAQVTARPDPEPIAFPATPPTHDAIALPEPPDETLPATPQIAFPEPATWIVTPPQHPTPVSPAAPPPAYQPAPDGWAQAYEPSPVSPISSPHAYQPTSGGPTSPAPQSSLDGLAPPAPPAAPGWHTDPLGQYRYRWWDGTRWTHTFHR